MPVIARIHSRRRPAFTLIELAIIAILICMLVAICCFAMAATNGRNARVRCAANLRSLGQAMNLYCNCNRSMYPRTSWKVGAPPDFGTCPTTSESMALTNDVTGSLFMLIKFADANPEQFICPDSDQDIDSMGNQPAMSRSNFSDWRRNLSYSYANPYPDTAAASTGYRLNNNLPLGFAVAADANPGGEALATLSPADPPGKLRLGNSQNHFRQGQNVLFGDGSVEWCTSCFVGTRNENIYTSQVHPASAFPKDSTDSVLLPAFPGPERRPWPWALTSAALSLLVLAGILAIAMIIARSRTKPASAPDSLPDLSRE